LRTRREDQTRYRWRDAIGILVTFHAICISWVFFRAASMTDAVGIFRTMATGWSGRLFPGGLDETELRPMVWIGIAVVAHLVRGLGLTRGLTAVRSPALIGVFWGLIVAAIIVLHAPLGERFIYFQF
jgi:hypothetical protein